LQGHTKYPILMGKVKIPKYGKDYSEDKNKIKADKKIQAMIDLNIKWYNYWVCCISTNEVVGKTTFCVVAKITSEKYPHGNLKQVYKNLKDKYTNNTAKIETLAVTAEAVEDFAFGPIKVPFN
jgi:hypothetical protein